VKEDIYSSVLPRDWRQVGESVQFQFIQSLLAFFFKYKSENKFFQDGFALQKNKYIAQPQNSISRRLDTEASWNASSPQ
jgi:hypothetical protein